MSEAVNERDDWEKHTKDLCGSIARALGHNRQSLLLAYKGAEMRTAVEDFDAFAILAREAKQIREALRELDATLGLIEAKAPTPVEGVH